MAKTSKSAKPTKKTAPKKAPAKPAKAPSAKKVPAPIVSPTPPLGRETLPIPDPQHVGLTTYDARDPNTEYPPLEDDVWELYAPDDWTQAQPCRR